MVEDKKENQIGKIQKAMRWKANFGRRIEWALAEKNEETNE
jgi:hypothetical protein